MEYSFDIRHDTCLRFEFPRPFKINFQYEGDRLDVNSPTGLKNDKLYNEWRKLRDSYKQLGKKHF